MREQSETRRLTRDALEAVTLSQRICIRVSSSVQCPRVSHVYSNPIPLPIHAIHNSPISYFELFVDGTSNHMPRAISTLDSLRNAKVTALMAFSAF